MLFHVATCCHMLGRYVPSRARQRGEAGGVFSKVALLLALLVEVACTLVPTASALAKSWGQREQTSAPSTSKAQLQSAQPQTQSNHVM